MPISYPLTGFDQLDIVEPVPCAAELASTGLALTANSAYLQLVRVTKPITVTKLSCYTSAATTSIDMSIMSAAYVELAGLSAKFLATAGGLSTGTLTAAFTYQPGVDYYHVIVPDTSVSVVRGYTGVAVILNAGTGNGTQRSLIKAVGQDTVPSSISTPSVSAVGIWIAGHN